MSKISVDIDLDAMAAKEREDLFVEMFEWVQRNDGRLPLEAYAARTQTWHIPFVDVAVVWRNPKGHLSVLLESRPETGHLYPGMRDVPGGNFTDRETIEEAAKRMLGKLGFSGKPQFAGVATYTKTRAGIGISILCVLVVEGETLPRVPEGCHFFHLDEEMPGDLVPWQAWVYPDMIRKFLKDGRPTLQEYHGQ